MPSLDNILSPFAIVGNDCSGTSLVSRALGNHCQCTNIGETVDLVHSVWKSLELFPAKRQLEIPDAIRHHFLRLFPSRSQYWLHSPVGIPMAKSIFDNEQNFLDWFWDVLERVFPKAKYFTVLQHPLDVLVSSNESLGTLESTINSNRLAARIVTHPRSQVMYAVNYRDLVQDPRNRVAQLLEYLGMEFEESCLEPFNVAPVANGPNETQHPHESNPHIADWFSQRDRWERIPRSSITTEYREAVDACWAKFDFDFGGWPV